jgi:phosphatidate cytidylyltransferase
MWELYKAVSGRLKTVHFVGFGLELIYSYCLYKTNILDVGTADFDYTYMLVFFAVMVVAVLLIMLVMVFRHSTNNIDDAAVTLFGFFYVGVLMSLICEIRLYGLVYSWMPFIFAFGSDTGAYFVGSKFGKHKLTPQLSPKKSVEGAIGGIVTVALLMAVYFYVCYRLDDSLSNALVVRYMVLGVIGAVFSQLGDLAASSIKRYKGIKDYGKIMPGHGGVLDRFDSVLFTIPVVFFSIFFI